MPPTQITKRFPIKNRIVNLVEAKRLANSFIEIYRRFRRTAQNKNIVFTITFENQDEYQSSSPDIFSEDIINGSNRVTSIQMRFSTAVNDNQITAYLTHDSSVEAQNEVIVRGNDLDWVDAKIGKLEDVINSFDPQNMIIKKFTWLLTLFFSASFGSLIGFLISAAVSPLPIDTVTSPFIESLLFPKVLLSYVWRYLICAFIGLVPAFYVVDKLKSLWPSVEIQIGPAFRFIEKRRRERLAQWIFVGVIPILLQLSYDLFTRK